ncbi:MAG TPA: uracil-DNA glycosylase [Methylomirabilota bacterium]|jgi:DNA polymerase|nr:uracil-DNA glycosylase [Methylomirabilota bacterium]
MATDSTHELLFQIAASLHHYVETLRESGVSGLPRAALAASLPKAAGQMAVAQAGDLFLSPKVNTVRTLEELRAEIGDCRRCKLCQGRTNIVFGVGNPQAELVFVGEGPGRDEDLKGEPFVGRAGQLLTEIITKGMKMRREDVYICNVVKCRPPENRNPEPDEIAACEPFLIKQLELIKPRIIVALGTFAAQTLLKSKTPISRLRGNWHSYQGIKLMPTLHPAYLLRNPADKKLVWQDIQAVLREMGRL